MGTKQHNHYYFGVDLSAIEGEGIQLKTLERMPDNRVTCGNCGAKLAVTEYWEDGGEGPFRIGCAPCMCER